MRVHPLSTPTEAESPSLQSGFPDWPGDCNVTEANAVTWLVEVLRVGAGMEGAVWGILQRQN